MNLYMANNANKRKVTTIDLATVGKAHLLTPKK